MSRGQQHFSSLKIKQGQEAHLGTKRARNKKFSPFPPPDALSKYSLYELQALEAEGLSKEKPANTSPYIWLIKTTFNQYLKFCKRHGCQPQSFLDG